MTKIMKYLKPYWLSIGLTLGLLFGQATCELTMPDYMQILSIQVFKMEVLKVVSMNRFVKVHSIRM